MANDKSSGKIDPEQIRLRKEEQARRGRRRTRQIIGVALSILIIAGAASIVSGVVGMVRDMLDNTAEFDEYNTRITPFVWFDVLPFDSLETADPNALKQVAIWSVMNKQSNDIERNENGEPLIPSIEVDRWGAAMFGPEFVFHHESFEDSVENLSYVYDEDTGMYTAQATGLTPQYVSTVVDIQKESGGIKRVTVGYVSTTGSNNELIAAPDLEHPSKFMDYVFRRDGSQYYLYAIEKNTEREIPISDSAAEAEEALAETPEDLIEPADEILEEQVPGAEDGAPEEQDAGEETPEPGESGEGGEEPPAEGEGEQAA